MAELNTLLESNVFTRMCAFHDAHDSGGPYTLTTSYAQYVNDGLTRDYSSMTLWSANHVDCSNLAIGSKLDIKVDSEVAASNKGKVISVKFECPNGGSPFTVEEVSITVASNTAEPHQWKLLGYVGPEVQQYGIDIYSKVDTLTADVSDRKLLVRA